MAVPDVDIPSPSVKKRRLLPRTWRGWALSFFILICLSVAGAYWLARQTPGWYQPPNVQSDQVLDAADAAQQKIREMALDLHNTLGKLPLGDQQWSISQDEVNSLLALKFANFHATATAPATSATQEEPPKGPAALASSVDFLSGPQIMFTPGRVTCGARSPKVPNSDPAGGVISLVFDVGTTTSSDGQVLGFIKLESAWAGLLPVPKFLIQNRMKELAPSLVRGAQRGMALELGVKDSSKMLPQVEATIDGIARGEGFPMEFTYEKHKVAIKEIRVEDGSLTIVFAKSVTGNPRATVQLK